MVTPDTVTVSSAPMAFTVIVVLLLPAIQSVAAWYFSTLAAGTAIVVTGVVA